MGIIRIKTPFLKYMGIHYRQFLPNVSRETLLLTFWFLHRRAAYVLKSPRPVLPDGDLGAYNIGALRGRAPSPYYYFDFDFKDFDVSRETFYCQTRLILFSENYFVL